MVKGSEYPKIEEHTLYLKMRESQKLWLYLEGYKWGTEDQNLILCFPNFNSVWPYKWKEYKR